jgi:flagellar protein FliS
MARRDLAARGTAISRALAIVGELHSTLNVKDGGDIARELDRLYSYITQRLLDVTAKGDESALEEIYKLLCTLREGWSQIAVPGGAATR